MAVQVVTNPGVWIDGYDLAADHSALTLTFEQPAVDATTFGNTTRVFRPGLASSSVDYQGFVSLGADEVETRLDGMMGSSRIVSIGSVKAAGEVAYLLRDMAASWSQEATVGSMYGFSVSGTGSGLPARGRVLEDGGTARTASFDGTGYEVGAVAAGGTLCGALHVLSVSGGSPTLDVVVESDADAGFASPTTRLTFGQATTVGAEWQTASGAITDTYYRVAVTVGGSTPSFLFVVTVGVGIG